MFSAFCFWCMASLFVWFSWPMRASALEGDQKIPPSLGSPVVEQEVIMAALSREIMIVFFMVLMVRMS